MRASTRSNRKELSRERILEVAAYAIRDAGFHGVGIADVMKSAGLTHGGFYAHFASRDALLRAAVERAGTESAAVIEDHMNRLTAAGVTPFRAFVETYLHESGVSERGNGCPIAALSSEIPGQCAEVLAASQSLVRRLHVFVQSVLPEGSPPDAAWNVTSAVLGALQLARALGDNDEGRAVLSATKNELLARYAG